jgi:gluconate 5-dehydrogenase
MKPPTCEHQDTTDRNEEDYMDVREAFDLSGETALITGGGTGLGFAMASCLSKAGATVIISGRRESVLADAAHALGEPASYRVHDVTQFDAAEDLIGSIAGGVSILINNAGHVVKKPTQNTTIEEFTGQLDTHITGAFSLARAVIPSMRAAGRGHILFTASMTSLFGVPEVIGYAAAKSAMLGMVRSLTVELAPHKIRANAIAPGWIWSDLLKETVEKDPERKNKVISRTPMGKFGDAEDIGWAAVYLCSPAARFVTGVCLPVDGGIAIGF